MLTGIKGSLIILKVMKTALKKEAILPQTYGMIARVIIMMHMLCVKLKNKLPVVDDFYLFLLVFLLYI